MERLFSRYSIRLLQKSNPLSPLQSKAVVDDLAMGLPEFNVLQYFGSQPTIFNDYDHLVVAHAHQDERAIGLLGARWLGPEDEKFLYLWTAMLADDYRQTTLFHRMLQCFFEQVFQQAPGVPDLIVTKTYNPVVYSIFKSFSEQLHGLQIYPLIPADRQDAFMTDLAVRITHGISPRLSLERETAVIRGGQAMVAPDFFPRMDLSRDAAVNGHFARHLSRADQILCVLRIPQAAKDVTRQWATPPRTADVLEPSAPV
jgi:hypothetical protein